MRSGPFSRVAVLAPVRRWTALRKQTLLAAVRVGAVTRDKALAVHRIGPDEWTGWERATRLFGPSALKVTRRKPRRPTYDQRIAALKALGVAIPSELRS